LIDIDAYKFAYTREYVKMFDQLIRSHEPDVVFGCWETIVVPCSGYVDGIDVWEEHY